MYIRKSIGIKLKWESQAARSEVYAPYGIWILTDGIIDGTSSRGTDLWLREILSLMIFSCANMQIQKSQISFSDTKKQDVKHNPMK